METRKGHLGPPPTALRSGDRVHPLPPPCTPTPTQKAVPGAVRGPPPPGAVRSPRLRPGARAAAGGAPPGLRGGGRAAGRRDAGEGTRGEQPGAAPTGAPRPQLCAHVGGLRRSPPLPWGRRLPGLRHPPGAHGAPYPAALLQPRAPRTAWRPLTERSSRSGGRRAPPGAAAMGAGRRPRRGRAETRAAGLARRPPPRGFSPAGGGAPGAAPGHLPAPPGSGQRPHLSGAPAGGPPPPWPCELRLRGALRAAPRGWGRGSSRLRAPRLARDSGRRHSRAGLPETPGAARGAPAAGHTYLWRLVLFLCFLVTPWSVCR